MGHKTADISQEKSCKRADDTWRHMQRVTEYSGMVILFQLCRVTFKMASVKSSTTLVQFA